ncbi:MAG: hypothetical protein SGJ27_05925 [Candidatus Melainabacteria bacterium]|nr:hypothetical protein [Candidatus Melainabacteria bacterium]
MTLNTILQPAARNDVDDAVLARCTIDDLIEEPSDEELDSLEAMLALFLRYSKDCWNDQLGTPGSELFFLLGAPPTQLLTAAEELELESAVDAVPDP